MERMFELVVPDFLATGIGIGSLSVLLLPPGETTVFARWSDFRKLSATELMDGLWPGDGPSQAEPAKKSKKWWKRRKSDG